MQVTSSDTVLITGAGGGVGGFAVQIAANRGAHVVGAASTNIVMDSYPITDLTTANIRADRINHAGNVDSQNKWVWSTR